MADTGWSPMRKGRRSLSVRVRAFLSTALAAMIMFGAGGWWLTVYARDKRMDAEIGRASDDARALAAAFATPDTPIQQAVPGQSNIWWIALDGDGRWFAASSLFAPAIAGFQKLDPSEILYFEQDFLTTPFTDSLNDPTPTSFRGYGEGFFTSEVVFWSDRSDVFLGAGGKPRTYTAAIATTKNPRPDHLPPGFYPDEPAEVAVVVLAMPQEADAVAATMRQALGLGVPIAVIFVAGIAWWVTGRALRPVERIRLRMAEIGESDPDLRVPVPKVNDEIGRLAETTNATLARLADALARQREFVADASHELRSPLATLRNSIEVQTRFGQDVDWREVAENVLAETVRMQALTEDLLLLARLDGGVRHGDLTVDLAGLAEEQIAERAHLDPRLTWHADTAGPALVGGDEGPLARILRNLLDNAARHAATTVTVRVTAQHGTVRLTVTDDGPGIAPEDRERVFDRFIRLDDARARDDGGSGLGLAIVRGVTARYGGTVVVGEGPGGEFVVELPEATDSFVLGSEPQTPRGE